MRRLPTHPIRPRPEAEYSSLSVHQMRRAVQCKFGPFYYIHDDAGKDVMSCTSPELKRI